MEHQCCALRTVGHRATENMQELNVQSRDSEGLGVYVMSSKVAGVYTYTTKTCLANLPVCHRSVSFMETQKEQNISVHSSDQDVPSLPPHLP